MNTIKFITSDKNQKLFTSTVRKNVNDYFTKNGLSTKGNFRTAVQTMIMISAYLLPFISILIFSVPGWLTILLCVLMGSAMAGIGMCVMHDAAHGSFSHKAWVNKLFGGTMYLLGSNVFTWKIQHNVLHHAYTNIEGYDHDIASRGPIRLSKHAPLKKIHRYQHIHAFFFYGLMTIMKITKDFSQLAEYNKAGLTRKHNSHPVFEFVKMSLVKLTYLATFLGLPLLFSGFNVWQVLAGFFIMHWTAGLILATVFQMAHVVSGVEQALPNNEGIIEDEWAVHELKTTADFARNNHFLNWYIGGLNFQIEHHLFPNICHVHYPKIAPIVERTAKEFGYIYNLKPSLANAISSHVSRLKELGREEEF